jgi:hypothetical protein
MTHKFKLPRPIMTPILTIVTLLATSCGKGESDLLAVYPCRGQVFVNGKPAENAEIFFHPIGNENPRTGASQAVIDKDGWYILSTYKDKDGAPEGNFIVTIVWPDGPKPPEEGYQAAKMPKPGDRLNGVYAKTSDSTLRRSIPRGGGVIETINLDVPSPQ